MRFLRFQLACSELTYCPAAVHTLQEANAACCTTAQPTYTGNPSGYNPPGFSGGLLTCSDGPCTGDGYSYPPSSSVTESGVPVSCCQPDLAVFYNPQVGQGFWIPEIFNTTYPGTGRPCDLNAPRWRCSIQGGVGLPGHWRLCSWPQLLLYGALATCCHITHTNAVHSIVHSQPTCAIKYVVKPK